MTLCDDALTQMNTIMSGHRNEHDIRVTYRIENDINQLRDRLKAGNIQAVNDHEYDYALGTIFADLISEAFLFRSFLLYLQPEWNRRESL